MDVHPLTSYCERHHIRLLHLAQRMRVADSTLSRLVRGLRRPSATLMAKIDVATDGEVTAAELFAVHFLPHRQNVSQNGEKSKLHGGPSAEAA